MTPDPTTARQAATPARGDALLALAVCVVVLIALRWQSPPPEPPRADALRYLEYSINLLEYGVFGLTAVDGRPSAGRANTPLYPLFLAAVLKSSAVGPSTLRCHLQARPERCAPIPATVYAVQTALAALGLVAITLLAWTITGTRRGAALATLAAVLSAQPQAFTSQLLTENLSLPLFALFTLALARRSDQRWCWEVVTGASLGLLTLTRPEFLYLSLAFVVWRGIRLLSAPPPLRRARGRAFVIVSAACVVFVAPWLWRNQTTFGDPVLTATYGGQILAQRVQYNRMTPAEFGVAFIYWLPDFGDSLARRLFPEEHYRRLGFQPGTYYADGLAYHAQRARELGGDAAATTALLRDDVFGHPFKHALITLPLAWRGVFVAKLWGLGGMLAFVAVVVNALRRQTPASTALLRVSWPAWFMLFFYAAVSVAIPRYSVCFVPIFSVAIALCLGRLFERRRALS